MSALDEQTIPQYEGSVTGPEMDQALLDMANHTSERYANGKAGGVPVSPGEVGYQDNSEYFKNQAAAQVSLAQAAAAAAANSAQRAESAVPAGTDAAVLWTRDQSTELTADDKAVARKNIMAGGSNPNLLVNSHFAVNQRGFTTGSSSNQYPADCWKTVNEVTATRSGNSLVLTAAPAGATAIVLRQTVENADGLLGETVTLSFHTNMGLKTLTVTLPSNPSADWYQNGVYFNSNMYLRLYYRVSTKEIFADILAPAGFTGDPITVYAAKLEKGSFSTLLNDARPFYGDELRRSQRYGIRYSNPNYAYLFMGFATSQIVVNCAVINSLRNGTRTVAFNNLSITNGISSWPVTSVSAVTQSEGLTRLQFIVESGLTYGNPYAVQINPNGYLDIFSDL